MGFFTSKPYEVKIMVKVITNKIIEFLMSIKKSFFSLYLFDFRIKKITPRIKNIGIKKTAENLVAWANPKNILE